MHASTGHTQAILASKVQNTPVFNEVGDRIGHVEDLILDKSSNEIMYAVIGFGGWLGIGEKYHPISWMSLDYSHEFGGYVVPMSKEQLEKAPVYDIGELTGGDGQTRIRQESMTYYGAL
jgi:sporulation protein YlmC with PRC-barrel domain